MKVKVLQRFIDKETRQLNERGSVIEVTEPRFKELATGGFVESVKEEKTEQSFNEMTLEQLKDYAKTHGVKLGNARTKAAIIDAIADAFI